MWSWFSNKQTLDLQVDIHSHLLPGIDDGVKTMDESLEILGAFQRLGFKKVITTPHIYPDYYPNLERDIIELEEDLIREKEAAGLSIEVEAAAEYFIDQSMIEKLKNKVPLLTFGDQYVLVETSFMSKPLIFDEVIFEMKAAGYRPVVAHPERYQYIDLGWIEQLTQQGVLFHLSVPSLVGAYGSIPKKIAGKILQKGLYRFAGSDIHRPRQMKAVREALKVKVPMNEIANNDL